MVGVVVYLSTEETVGETLTALKGGRLQKATMDMACGGHGQGNCE